MSARVGAGVSVRVSVSSDLSDFAGIWPDLAALNAVNPDLAGFPFQARDYLEIWLETLGVARRTKPLFVRVDGKSGAPWLLLPLGVEIQRGLRTLRFLDGGVVDYAAPIVFPRAAEPVSADALWTAILAALPPVDLVDIQKLAALVIETPNPLFVEDGRDHKPSAYRVKLSGAWPDFAKTVLPRTKNTRRDRRRLAKLGDLRFVVAAEASERSAILEAMFRQKGRKYLETRGANPLERPALRAYFTQLSERFGSQGAVHLAALKVGGEIVASHWGLVSGRTFFYMMPATEGGDWRTYGAGNLLVEDLLEWCFAHGMTGFDMGVGDELYKFDYQPERQRLMRFTRGRSLIGKAYVPAWHAWRNLRARPRPAPEAKSA